MTVPRWADLTWEEARDLPRGRLVALLPVGAMEAHGPHLPLGTDVLIAEAMARDGAERLGRRGVRAVLLPAFPYTAAPFGAAFPGTLSIEAGVMTGLLISLATELGRQGFAALGVANGHLDPAHLAALAGAGSRTRTAGMPIVCPDLTRKPWASRLTEEFRSGACHAGRYEGSIVMAERASLVRDDVRRALPPNPASLLRAIRAGASTFEEAGGPQAYFGWPADATAEEGRATVEALGQILCDAVLEALEPGRATP